MFKDLQNYLLLRYPLLWNIKIVPLLTAMLIIHAVFFIIGYVSGEIDFTETGIGYYLYKDDNAPLIIFFSVLIGVLVFIIWMVFYFRNNAYKSFYPISNTSLYKEWLLLALACIINCSYSASYLYAKDLRARNYFTEKEFLQRTDVLSMASLFAEGSFNEPPYKLVDKNGVKRRVDLKAMTFAGREYSLTSLLNKSINRFSYQSAHRDSLNQLRVKKWLADNRKDSVLWLMTEFEKIAKGHNLKSNISPKQWLNLVYDYPDYTTYTTVGKIESYPSDTGYEYDDYDYTQTQYIDPVTHNDIDTLSNDIKVISGRKYIYPKNYVPLLQLNKSYDRISKSWEDPDIDSDVCLFYLYFGFSLSMAVFSFRVTAGRAWLIALVSLGIAGMLTGVLSFASSGDAFAIIWLALTAGLAIYFVSVCITKSAKGISAIVLNAFLWMAVWFIPLLYLVLLYSTRPNYPSKEDPGALYEWLRYNNDFVMYGNFIFIIAYMYFLTIAIKNWKGIAED
jgi:hypothetical protein